MKVQLKRGFKVWDYYIPQIIIRFMWKELKGYSEEQGEMKQIKPVFYFYIDRILFINTMFWHRSSSPI